MEKAILAGPMLGEFGWSLLRFAPYVLWNKIKKHNNKIKLIVLTRPERFDLYGVHADILEPIKINEKNKLQDCFRLTGISNEEYHNIAENFYKKYYDKFHIIDHIYPTIEKKKYTEKNQYQSKHLLYDFKPRIENKLLIDNYIPKNKPLIALGPRFRKNIKRNWNKWEEFYNLISNDNYLKSFNFVLCGKDPDYIPDNKNRFYDVNHIKLNDSSSLVGVTIEAIKRSVLTIGSQSGIPNLSMILGTRVLEWGNEKKYHTVTYNTMKTEIVFLDDKKYQLQAKKLLKETIDILKKKGF